MLTLRPCDAPCHERRSALNRRECRIPKNDIWLVSVILLITGLSMSVML